MISDKFACCPVSYFYLIQKRIFFKFNLVCNPAANFIVMAVVCTIIKSLVKCSCKSYKYITIFFCIFWHCDPACKRYCVINKCFVICQLYTIITKFFQNFQRVRYPCSAGINTSGKHCCYNVCCIHIHCCDIIHCHAAFFKGFCQDIFTGCSRRISNCFSF